jgi:Arc/MetJ-type ribon-helix-helix transcriptional regulator
MRIEQITIRCTPQMIEKLDQAVAEGRWMNRSEAARALIARGLEEG